MPTLGDCSQEYKNQSLTRLLGCGGQAVRVQSDWPGSEGDHPVPLPQGATGNTPAASDLFVVESNHRLRAFATGSTTELTNNAGRISPAGAFHNPVDPCPRRLVFRQFLSQQMHGDVMFRCRVDERLSHMIRQVIRAVSSNVVTAVRACLRLSKHLINKSF